jgi:hypothetical protein
MKTSFIFWYNDDRWKWSKSNPFSGLKCSLKDAKQWAKQLSLFNPGVDTFFYMAKYGRKVYEYHKGE